MKLQPGVSYLFKVFLFSLVYFITADLGLRLNAISGFATLFWLPSGFSLAVLLLFGTRFWPGITIAAFLVNYLHGAPLPVAGAIALGNTAEALFGTYLLQKVVKLNPSLEEVKDVVGLILFAALGSTLVSATIGVTSLWMAGLLKASYLSTWSAWWMGDMLSALLIAPFLLVWSGEKTIHFSPKRTLEGLLWIVSAISVVIIMYAGAFGIKGIKFPFTYLVFPPLIWAALRFGQREVVTGTCFFALIAVWGTLQGYGPFVRPDITESLFTLQSFMVILSITAMLLAAAIAERRILELRKDNFISFASHELKTPLTSVKVFTQILQKSSKKGSKNRNYLDRLEQQVDKLTYLINDMLDLTKIQKNTLDLRKERFSLQLLVEEVVETMQATSPAHQIVVKGKKLPEVYADRDRLSQVLINLLSNAIKYSPKGKKIVIETSSTAKQVFVGIKDYGMGIAAKDQEKIFDRFYRSTTEKTQTIPGLGVGLYISSVIVHRHGGEMRVKSTLGKGSTFSFTLPRTV